MSDPPVPSPADTPGPRRRHSDFAPDGEENPDTLYERWRQGGISNESLAEKLPLNTLFEWRTRQRITDAELAALMAGREIHEVRLEDLPKPKSAAADSENRRRQALIAALDTHMASFERTETREEIGEADLKAVFLARTPLVDGVGLRLGFAKTADGAVAPPGTTPQLSLLCRAYLASTSMQCTVKCEAVFRGAGLDEFYCRIVVPLPIRKGGRRRLLVSILDNETRQPVTLPANLAEIFHEKYLLELKLLTRPPRFLDGVGAAVGGLFGRLFKH